MRDILLKRMGFVLRLMPTWVALPIALGGSMAFYNFWTARLATTPPLNLFGFMFAGVCVFAALVAGVRDLERRNREAKLLLRRRLTTHFDSAPTDEVEIVIESRFSASQNLDRPNCQQTTPLRTGGKTHFSRNVASGCINSPACKYKSDSRRSRQIAPKSQRRSHSDEASD